MKVHTLHAGRIYRGEGNLSNSSDDSGLWYFNIRGGVRIGPFASHEEAVRRLDGYIARCKRKTSTTPILPRWLHLGRWKRQPSSDKARKTSRPLAQQRLVNKARSGPKSKSPTRPPPGHSARH